MPLALHVAYIVAIITLLVFFLRYRERLHRSQGRFRGDPIPLVHLEEFDQRFRSDELGPTRDAEVHFIGSGAGVVGGTTDTEAWVLAVLAKDARRLFEFGTATGRTTYLWARNTADDARISTLTLPPEQREGYQGTVGDSRWARKHALHESAFTHFRYQGTPEEGKVEQLFGDSKELDTTPWEGRCELIFIDGSHAYSYVQSDTEKALRMIAPGGVVIWHDYFGRWGTTADVYRYLNRLARELPLRRLHGTTMVAYRAPTA